MFDEFKGSVTQLAQILDDVKTLVVDEEEWKKANLVKTEDKNAEGQPIMRWNWTDEGTEKEVSIGQESVDYLRTTIKTKSEAGQLTITDKAIITLLKKLN